MQLRWYGHVKRMLDERLPNSAGCFTGNQTALDLLVNHASAGSTTSKRLCGVEAPHWLRPTIKDAGEGTDRQTLGLPVKRYKVLEEIGLHIALKLLLLLLLSR